MHASFIEISEVRTFSAADVFETFSKTSAAEPRFSVAYPVPKGQTTCVCFLRCTVNATYIRAFFLCSDFVWR